MKNRLEVAKTLLTSDGTIFINVDDKEYSYLKVICDDVFGRENFLNVIIVKTSDPSGHKTVNPSPYSQTEYILLYSKHKLSYKYEMQYIGSEYDSGYNQLIINYEDNYSEWKAVGLFDFLSKEKGFKDTRDANKKLGHSAFGSVVAEYALKNKERIFQGTAIADDAAKDIVQIRDKSKSNPGKIFKVERDKEDVFIKDGRQVYFYSNKIREIDGILTPSKPLTDLWTDIPYNGISNEGNVKLKNGKKPEKLLRRIIEISTDEGDIVLDYHLGSGTTCAVAHKMNRRYIGIEQLDYGENDSVVRLKNVIAGEQTGISKTVIWQGGGSFIYAELMKINQKFIDEIQSAKKDKDLDAIWLQMQETTFLSYKIIPEQIKKDVHEFEALSFEDKQKFLIDVLDKNLLYVNYNEINSQTHKVSNYDKAMNQKFYSM